MQKIRRYFSFTGIMLLSLLWLIGCQQTQHESVNFVATSRHQQIATIRLELGYLYLEQHNQQAARHNFEQAYRYQPDQFGPRLGLACYFYTINEEEKAQVWLERAVKSNETHRSPHLCYHYFLANKGLNELAQQQYELALKSADYDMIEPITEKAERCFLSPYQIRQ